MRHECFSAAPPHASGDLSWCVLLTSKYSIRQVYLHWLMRGSSRDAVIPLRFKGVVCWIFYPNSTLMSGNPGAGLPATQTPFSSPSATYFLPVKQMRSLNTPIWIVTSSTILNTVSNPFPSQNKPQEAVTQLCLWVTQHDAPLLSGDSTLPLASIGNELRLSLAGSDLSEMSGPRTLAVPCWPVSGEGQGTPRARPQPAVPDPRWAFGSGVCRKFCVPRHGQAAWSHSSPV